MLAFPHFPINFAMNPPIWTDGPSLPKENPIPIPATPPINLAINAFSGWIN